MHFIVVGAGNVGRLLVDIASRSRNDVVVVEHDVTRANDIANEYDCLVLNEDATREETLKEAGAARADALISTRELDATNLFVCLLATELGIPTVVSVLHQPEHRELFRKMGVNAVKSPDQLAAESLYRTARQPAIIDYMPVEDDAEVFEIKVSDAAPIAGKTLEDARSGGLIPDDVLVVAVVPQDGSGPRIARSTTEIGAGDRLAVYSGRGTDPAVTDLFGFFDDYR
ncbi:K+ transport system, NAD-binding component [Natrinema pellirubrum DSM 15624]|uniref:K+ transport system, NAD-binding component n=1 Tax=Natrinema pellirubrum (strain DSM 15624 / CIP 106293 / JCM 10476 / NCIMB 786 / 157) TaxID=797303 RepID=L0JF12_NATP1|nr:TrkA family potassium uptake protein [Natrinema pellirubrum]AGB30130.1 K+ transport system, NAD-binding component [Natrinema pellirubrum DSM 15624]